MKVVIAGGTGHVGSVLKRGLRARGSRAGSALGDTGRSDSNRSAAMKGAILALAAHALFCVGLQAFFGGPRYADEPAKDFAFELIAGVALLPTLLVGVGLGWLARHLRRLRALALVMVALPAPVVVFSATFGLLGLSLDGLLIGALLGLIFSTLSVPIAVVAALLLVWWVRPVQADPIGPGNAAGDGFRTRSGDGSSTWRSASNWL